MLSRITAVLASTLLFLLVLVAPGHAAFPGANGKIAFESNRSGNYEIYAMDPDGTGITPLTQNEASDTQPVWSPDGSKLALIRQFVNPSGAQESLFVMNADGTGEFELLSSQFRGLTWRPDGQQVGFTAGTSCGHGSCFEFDIFTINLDGSGMTSLGRTPQLSEDAVDWSPDGGKIAVGGFVFGGDASTDIWTVNADGSGFTPLATGPANDHNPSWSPDGTEIAFDSDRDGNAEVYVMNADGTNVRRLTNDPGGDGAPVWSPDGTKIAFVRDGDIWTMDPDGVNQVKLTDAAGYDSLPDWQPIPGPRRSDYKNAAQFCKAEREFLGDAAFARKYGSKSPKKNVANAYGKCVSGK
jgi:Tol biopolymer transport system component